MHDIRWLDIPGGDRDASKHPTAIFIDMQQHSVFRVLQVRFEDGDWCDIPIVAYVKPNAEITGLSG